MGAIPPKLPVLGIGDYSPIEKLKPPTSLKEAYKPLSIRKPLPSEKNDAESNSEASKETTT